MKKRVLLVSVMLVMSFLFAATAFAGSQDFELINNTGHDITHVYVSPTSVNDWQEDILGQDILENGESVVITFQRGTRAAHWDIKVTYANGSEEYWENFNLKSISTVILKPNGRASYQ